MKVIVFGGGGMVGQSVINKIRNYYQIVAPNQSQIDIANKKSIKELLQKEKPQVVINFAAITDVNRCELQRDNKSGLVWKVNAIAPGIISGLASEVGAKIIQISTDLVFPGNDIDPGPYTEAHEVGDYDYLTWYGASKAEGEKNVQQNNSNATIIRIIYPIAPLYKEKLDYARKILQNYDNQALYPMFSDQIMNVTLVDELTLAITKIIQVEINGTFHVASNDFTTPYDFATYLLSKTRKNPPPLNKASIDKFLEGKEHRRYPKNGGLKTIYSQSKLGVVFKSWKEVVNTIAYSLQTI